MSAPLVERILHIPGIPEHDHIHDQAQHTQLILLPLAIALTQLASLAMKHMAGDTVPSLATIQLRLNASTIVFVVKKVEHVQRFRNPAQLGNGSSQGGGVASAL